MKKNIQYILFSVAIIGFASCKTNLKQEPISNGSADFTRYVAIGNSLTSGYLNGALSREGQINSFPKMLSEQFQLANGGTFTIPYLDNGAGNDGSGNPARVLSLVTACNGVAGLSPVLSSSAATPLNNVSSSGPYNLIGVPGARAIDCNWNVYSTVNPFLNRFCQTPGVSTMTSEAMRANPTFFTFWLGNNDVLGYATAGAIPPATIFSPKLSDTTEFRVAIANAIDSLTKFGAKGAIANIPNVTSIPFFTTIPWNSAVLTQAQADTLNQIYTGTGITWNAGANGLMIVDTTVTAKMRHATANDLILLTTPGDSLKCGSWGVNPFKPLADEYVLDYNEVAEIINYTTIYNLTIQDIANKKGLALVDMNSYMKKIVSGILYNGINMNAKFVTGGAFSLDGVHPTPRGYALIANEFIKSINSKFGSTIPSVNVANYKGVQFP